jgi:hypothetical protein
MKHCGCASLDRWNKGMVYVVSLLAENLVIVTVHTIVAFRKENCINQQVHSKLAIRQPLNKRYAASDSCLIVRRNGNKRARSLRGPIGVHQELQANQRADY